MKKFYTIMLVGLIFVSLILSGCQNEAKKPDATPDATPAKTTEINFVYYYAEKHPAVAKGFQPWAKSLEEKSGNALKFNNYTVNTLVPTKDSYQATADGMIDLLAYPTTLTSAQFPTLDISSLPFIAPGSEAGSLLMEELAQKYPKEFRSIFDDTKLLWFWGSATSQLNTTKKLVKNLDDLKGMKILAHSAANIEMLKLLGANPIEMPTTDMYMALERGVAEGVLLPLAPLKSLKLSDVTKYHTIIDTGTNAFYGVMNTKKFDSLSPELKKAFEESTGKAFAQQIGKTLDEADVTDGQWMKDNGHTFYALPEAEKATWAQMVKPYTAEWVKKMEAKGFANIQEIVDDAYRLSKEIGQKTGRGYQE